ncbi:unnamed protein product (macronuclear) [Paramecium tetraurelia]|uniref:Protein kinase domain-containing protein n=1 Tax=Paramecium tetraurelia TaxID=5888 RepID=A0BZ26_PARTE|nr:uncharacterized protein GSPATT00033646001 [Paramecium tetraurelia]CAK63793.1 unnamed protein product [Paramecium tetraurelia]|eukprot:XP_001431191.1 hypothetical protein (macronuclear) [Paramecium tetraurelia strain d4-2]
MKQIVFDKVYEGFHTLNDEIVAIKQLDLIILQKDKQLNKPIGTTPIQINQLQRIEIMCKLSHKNIVKLFELLNNKKSLLNMSEMCFKQISQTIDRKQVISEYQVNSSFYSLGYRYYAPNTRRFQMINQERRYSSRYETSQSFQIQSLSNLLILELLNMLRIIHPNYLYLKLEVQFIWYFKQQKRQHYSTKCDIWSLRVIFIEILHFDVIFYPIYNTLKRDGWSRPFTKHQNLIFIIQK